MLLSVTSFKMMVTETQRVTRDILYDYLEIDVLIPCYHNRSDYCKLILTLLYFAICHFFPPYICDGFKYIVDVLLLYNNAIIMTMHKQMLLGRSVV